MVLIVSAKITRRFDHHENRDGSDITRTTIISFPERQDLFVKIPVIKEGTRSPRMILYPRDITFSQTENDWQWTHFIFDKLFDYNCTRPWHDRKLHFALEDRTKEKMERLALIFRHRIDPYFRIYNDSDDDLNRHRSTVIRAGPIRFSTTYRRSIMIFRLSKKILRHDTC